MRVAIAFSLSTMLWCATIYYTVLDHGELRDLRLKFVILEDMIMKLDGKEATSMEVHRQLIKKKLKKQINTQIRSNVYSKDDLDSRFGQLASLFSGLNNAMSTKAEVSALNLKADKAELNLKADLSALNSKADKTALALLDAEVKKLQECAGCPTEPKCVKVTNPSPVGNAEFGHDVDVSEGSIIVGAPYWGNAAVALSVGKAFIMSNSYLSQPQTLNPPDEKLTVQDYKFGYSVAIDNTTAIVSALGGGSEKGAVYAYEKSGSSFTNNQLSTKYVMSSTSSASDSFGCSVAISEKPGTPSCNDEQTKIVVIGAREHDEGALTSLGAAYVVDYSTSTGFVGASLTPLAVVASVATLRQGDNFGTSVAIDGDIIAVTAPKHDIQKKANCGTPDNEGAVFVFEWKGSAWTNTAVLTHSDSAPEDSLGLEISSVSVSGERIAVGAKQKDATSSNTNTGAVYIFERVFKDDTTSKWEEIKKLDDKDGLVGDQFGFSVDFAGDDIVVGVPKLGANSIADHGGATVFSSQAGGLQVARSLLYVEKEAVNATTSGGTLKANDNYGWSVAIDKGIYAISAPQDDSTYENAGAVYVCETSKKSLFGVDY